MGKKRIFLKEYDSSGKFPDGRVKLDVYFKSSDGEEYVWTPDWERGTRQLFKEAYRIEGINRPESPEKKRFEDVAEEVLSSGKDRESYNKFKLEAIRLGEQLKYQTSLNQINRIASACFNFNVREHPNENITSTRAQVIYNWVMTLYGQPMSEREKSELLKRFADALRDVPND